MTASRFALALDQLSKAQRANRIKAQAAAYQRRWRARQKAQTAPQPKETTTS